MVVACPVERRGAPAADGSGEVELESSRGCRSGQIVWKNRESVTVQWLRKASLS